MPEVHKHQVRRFYEELWNRHDLSTIPKLLDEAVTFRGSLGESCRGHAAVAAYVDRVHHGLDRYDCHIHTLIGEDDRVFARMLFSGVHRGEFMGYAATGQPLAWAGCALFTFVAQRITDVWVLGDLKSLEQQVLGAAAQ